MTANMEALVIEANICSQQQSDRHYFIYLQGHVKKKRESKEFPQIISDYACFLCPY